MRYNWKTKICFFTKECNMKYGSGECPKSKVRKREFYLSWKIDLDLPLTPVVPIYLDLQKIRTMHRKNPSLHSSEFPYALKTVRHVFHPASISALKLLQQPRLNIRGLTLPSPKDSSLVGFLVAVIRKWDRRRIWHRRQGFWGGRHINTHQVVEFRARLIFQGDIIAIFAEFNQL